jgi:ribonuclease D
MPTLPIFVDTQADLNRVCEIVSHCDTVALDTEFVRTRTYAPHLGLLQIAAADMIVCVDPLANLDYSTLWQLLFDPARANILHSASQDLEVMWFQQGGIINNLIDTQICAAFLNYPPQIGYAGLVDDLFGVTISKEQTRTNWTRRPLTDEQIDYAAKDVVHLHEMHKILRERLEAKNRYNWALEDSAALCNLSLYMPNTENAWQRIKSIPFMPAKQQPRAIRLAQWREERAVKLDKPRKWVIDDKIILELAAANPANEQALANMHGIPEGLARRQSSYLLDVLAKGNDDYARNPAAYIQEIPNRERDTAINKKLMKIVKRKAAELEIPAEILASRRDINAIRRSTKEARVLSGWRFEIIGQELQAAL